MRGTPETATTTCALTPITRLARWLTWLLRLDVAVALINATHRIWGATSGWGIVAGSDDLQRVIEFDRASFVLDVGELGTTILTAILWLAWEQTLVKAAAPGALRRTARWHAVSWLIPFASMVLPFRNVQDLWGTNVRSAATAPREPIPFWVWLWWFSWILGDVVQLIVPPTSDAGMSRATARGFEWLLGGGALLTALAGTLAIELVSRLTSGATESSTQQTVPM
jgi:hypothetical protein